MLMVGVDQKVVGGMLTVSENYLKKQTISYADKSEIYIYCNTRQHSDKAAQICGRNDKNHRSDSDR